MLAFGTGPILINFPHGLGDTVQLTIALRHLQRRGMIVDVQISEGKGTLIQPYCRHVFTAQEKPEAWRYEKAVSLNWYEPAHSYPDLPSTKPYYCLQSEFGFPLEELTPMRYEIPIGQLSRDRVSAYINKLPQGPIVLIHYQGEHGGWKKNLEHATIARLCAFLLKHKHVPVILDWQNRSPVYDQKRVFCPTAQDPLWKGQHLGDGETIIALAERASLVIAVDSGPLHCAMATKTKIIATWHKTHPVHFADHDYGSVTHLVPVWHRRFCMPVKGVGLKYFEKYYKYREYEGIDDTLLAETAKQLGIGEAVGQ